MHTPTPAQARQNPRKERGSRPQIPLLVEEPLAMDNYWERGTFLYGAAPGMLTTLQGRPHFQE